jgi:hypothetical protein
MPKDGKPADPKRRPRAKPAVPAAESPAGRDVSSLDDKRQRLYAAMVARGISQPVRADLDRCSEANLDFLLGHYGGQVGPPPVPGSPGILW